MSLHYRLWLLFAPLVTLLTLLGVAVVVSLGSVGDRIDAILRENYRSVEAMAGLNEALERIDSSFQLTLLGRPDARQAFESHWAAYREHLAFERSNITEPGEAELVEQLAMLSDRYRDSGERFFAAAPGADRKADYLGSGSDPGLLGLFRDIKDVSGRIRRLNQESMQTASRNARQAAAAARGWALAGLAAALAATGLLAWRTGVTILRPVAELTRSARAVGGGRFDQLVPPVTHDEIGELVATFNHMTAQLRDLRQTGEARLLRARQASQATVDAFPDPVLVIDPEGRVELANPAARALLGVVPTDGRPGTSWRPPDALERPVAEALRSDKPFLTESYDQAVTFHAGGGERLFLPQVLPVRDPYGNPLGAAVVLHDVTRFRLLDELKTNLVATASHELKTPLTGIRLAVHLLLEEAVGPLTPKQMELLIDARDNTERLVRIIDHLLSLARLERGLGGLELRPVAPATLLNEAAEAVRPMAEDRHLTLAVEAEPGLPPVAADHLRLGHALNNLLVNAVTYTGPGGAITLAARPAADGRVELSVRDTGVGIPAEYLPRVFDKFFRVPGQSKGDGTGLGLAIVREVVTAHGGDITCESRPGEGTTFRLSLPTATEVRP
jgi:NtrC-family two-component system sensor histidine kinase KinB